MNLIIRMNFVLFMTRLLRSALDEKYYNFVLESEVHVSVKAQAMMEPYLHVAMNQCRNHFLDSINHRTRTFLGVKRAYIQTSHLSPSGVV